MAEAQYQAQLIKRLEVLFPGCLILKNDSGYRQGIPDLTILWNDRWAMLEVKMSREAPYQPNQEYYLHLAQLMSFASVIYPECELEVLDELQRSFSARRSPRLSRS